MNMKDNCILTAESVTEGHPDKLCDTIADAVVDACLTQDAAARVACEVMATAGKIIAAGEITAAKIPDIPAIICRTVREAGYGGSDYEVEVITHEQSPDIAEAVCGGTETGAGDQGILYGFACDETKELLPLPVVLAHRLTRLLTDARRQGIIPCPVSYTHLFHYAFYPILNLAWGGDWGGMNGVDESALPVTMKVDYVRVCQKK